MFHIPFECLLKVNNYDNYRGVTSSIGLFSLLCDCWMGYCDGVCSWELAVGVCFTPASSSTFFSGILNERSFFGGREFEEKHSGWFVKNGCCRASLAVILLFGFRVSNLLIRSNASLYIIKPNYNCFLL